MPFASINPTHARTNFGEKILRIGCLFLIGHFGFYFQFFFFISMKISQRFLGSKDGSNWFLVSSPKQHLRKDMQHSVHEQRNFFATFNKSNLVNQVNFERLQYIKSRFACTELKLYTGTVQMIKRSMHCFLKVTLLNINSNPITIFLGQIAHKN